MEEHAQIVVVDLGSQYTRLIGRTLRDIGVRSVIVSPSQISALMCTYTPRGIILSGGAASVYDTTAPHVPADILESDVPILGICYGMHWLAHQFGGKIEPIAKKKEYGPAELNIMRNDDPLLANFPPLYEHRPAHMRNNTRVWASHGDSITHMPEEFSISTFTENFRNPAVIRHRTRPIWGIQFHPEVPHTEHGKKIFENFVEICGAQHDWVTRDIVEEIRARALSEIPENAHCILGFSGGVDSTVLAVILAPVLRGRLTLVSIDAGHLRRGEIEHIIGVAQRVADGNLDHHVIDYSEGALQLFGAHNTIDAEKKRELFRELYARQLEKVATAIGATILLQGTLAPDLIESGVLGDASHIKQHHNAGLKTWLTQIHPLRELFKYEVRDIGRHLGLSDSIVEREPFPGPGLFCRVVGVPVSAEGLEITRWADAEVREILEKANIAQEISQLVVALIGTRMVGVKGDGRTYGYPIAIRAVETSDFMTARGYRLPETIKGAIEARLTQHSEIVHVGFFETSKPPATIEFE